MEEANIGFHKFPLVKTCPFFNLLNPPLSDLLVHSKPSILSSSCFSASVLAVPTARNAFPPHFHVACPLTFFKVLFRCLLIREIFHNYMCKQDSNPTSTQPFGLMYSAYFSS